MNVRFPALLLPAAAALAACNATAPSAPTANRPSIDPVERVRADAALDVFQDLALRDEGYAVYFQGEASGYLERTRGVRGGQIEVISVLTSRNENIAERTITEKFDAGAPHDATLLQIEEANGDVARIVRTETGYVAEATRDGVSSREILFDFRFRLADALAAEIWVRDGAEVGDCLSYPGYSLGNFSRVFNRECIIADATPTIDGKEVDAVRTRINSIVRTLRERASGMELRTRQSLDVEMRLEPRAITTEWHVPSEIGVELQEQLVGVLLR